MKRKMRLLFIAPAAILAMLLVAALGGELVKLLWNWLLPEIFGWRAITFWQAVGLLALCRILFGGIGPYRAARHRVGHRVRERWEGMTPEQRERFREAVRARWGFVPPTHEEKSQ